ncbi:MAG: hypothetical protein ACK5B9_11730 [Flavobacteriia bacterium]|jgi:hypothetical protein
MSENLDLNSNQPQGKGLAVGGFILSLVGLLFTGIIGVIAAGMIMTGGSPWLAYLWVVLCIASVVMSAMGMSKLGKTGGKKGLGIAGLIIGIVATVWSLLMAIGLGAINEGVGDAKIDLQELSNDLQKMENQ